MKLLRIHLPDELHARLKVQCAMVNCTMQGIAAATLERWTESQEEKWAAVVAQQQAREKSGTQKEGSHAK